MSELPSMTKPESGLDAPKFDPPRLDRRLRQGYIGRVRTIAVTPCDEHPPYTEWTLKALVLGVCPACGCHVTSGPKVARAIRALRLIGESYEPANYCSVHVGSAMAELAEGEDVPITVKVLWDKLDIEPEYDNDTEGPVGF